jgi:hypothetical protein
MCHSTLRISGKNLGSLALADACHRCFWIKQRLKSVPFSVFPGIFSTFDAFNKRLVHGAFDSEEHVPIWLRTLGEFKGYIDPPSHHHFQLLHKETGILVTGSADGIFVKEDRSYTIVDYKTAKFTDNQDFLLPMYEVQLNCYALIAESLGMSPVSALALIYFDPSLSFEDVQKWKRDYGFDVGLSTHILPVILNPDKVESLLQLAKEILMLPEPPPRSDRCKDCQSLEDLQILLGANQ